MKANRRRVDGVLLLDKPCGISSNTALQEAKRLLAAAKAGHAGTLDPFASGLLLLLFGEATKFAQFALDSDKEYLADVRLGVATASGDREGAELERRPVEVSDAALAAALERFRGEIEQVPPMYSALKQGGTPLYKLARAGRSVERAARRVRIHALELLGREESLVRLRARVSKGTYVRQLAADLGEALGTGAHLEELRRTAVGGFRLEQAVDLDTLRTIPEAERDRRLLVPEALLEGLPLVRLDAERARRFTRGEGLEVSGVPEGRCRVVGEQGGLLGVGEGGAGGALRPVRVLAGGASG